MRTVAVCLVSGGLDSCVAAYWARAQGWEVRFLSVNYGQVMQKELSHAERIGQLFGPSEHEVLEMQRFSSLSRSSRTDASMIAKGGVRWGSGPHEEISTAYPPGRDPSLLFVAAGWVESIMLESQDDVSEGVVVIGTNRNDALMFPDCRPGAYKLLNMFLADTTKISVQFGKRIRIETPLIDLNKAEVVRLGRKLGAPLEDTWSCYEGGAAPCRACEPCQLRDWAFQEAEASPDVVAEARAVDLRV